METASPPLTPVGQYMSPLNQSPTNSYREQLRRRHSSFSSNHDRSPISIRKNRFSNASQYSNDFSPNGGEGDGMGNLADELDQLDEDMDAEDDTNGRQIDYKDETEQPSPVDGARDSGIDVSYSSRTGSPRIKNLSKPVNAKEEPPDEAEASEQDKFSQELEDAMNGIARMSSQSTGADDPLFSRTIALLQNLGDQSNLETGAQRLATSTNSMTSHLAAQSKAIQALLTSLYSPFNYFAPIDPMMVEETTPLVDALMKELPMPDPTPLQGMQKLDRDTRSVNQTLSQLTDTLQMGKQTTNAASRHLRTTQSIVAELRRERERAESARVELSTAGWDDKLRNRWCAGECKDIVSGFEVMCDSLRNSLELAAGTASA